MPDHLGGKHCLFLSLSVAAVAVCFVAASAASASHVNSTPQKVFDAMRGNFQPAKAKGVISMGPERPEWRPMVDRGKRRDL